ncbi:MAG: hypothetical protein GXO31_01510 [Epsilonproteobacteria bacterium]|nr:hypothetical protein [Campylobacterota bacterium]
MLEKTFWVIVDKNGDYYPRFCMKTKEESIKKFEEFSMREWPKMEEKGFKCIKVKIVPYVLKDNLQEQEVSASVRF